MLCKKMRVFSFVLCIILVLAGCTAVNKNPKKKIVYVVEDDEIYYYNNSDNSNDNSSNQASADGETDSVKPISSGQWKQKMFYLSSCSIQEDYDSLVIYKEAGFNLAEGCLKGDNAAKEIVENCNKIGGIYVLANNRYRFTLDAGLVFNETSVRKSVYEYAALDKNRLIIGYNVHDEPVFTESFPVQDNRMIGYLNKYDPNSLKFINLLPSYGVYTWDSAETSSAFGGHTYEEYVDEFIRLINPQVLSVDYYPYLMGQAGYTGDWFRDMGLFRNRSLKNNITAM